MTDKKKILVVIDMQNDFIDGPLGTPEARGIVDKVCDKIRGEEWDAILVTQDTHDNDYLGTQEGRKLPIEHCIENTKGWLINNEIFGEFLKLDHVKYYKKDTFGDRYLHFEIFRIAYELDPAFEDKDIDLTLVGVCTDICVISNALLLKAYFPEMNIIVDAACCAGTSPEKHRMALEVMKSCQIDVLEEEIMRELKNWNELTKGLYRYVIAPGACYEIHILHWDHDTDILSANCTLYVVGEWRDSDGSYFEREELLTGPMAACLQKAVEDFNDNVEEKENE